MNEERVIFIIPGFKHLPTNKPYKEIARILKNEGYLPILITIPWKKTTISENTEYFLREYSRIDTKKKYILGFSFGAMIALIASTKIDTSGLILCSLSPYFQEDFAKGRKRASIKAKHFRDFSKLHSASLAKKIKTSQTLMLYGANEERSLIRRVTKTFDLITSSKKHLIQITGVDHDIGHKQYLHVLKKVAKTLN